MNAWGIAVTLSVGAASVHAVAAVFQEHIAGDRRARSGRRLGTLRMLWLPRWWWAVVLTGAAAGLHVVALHFGPLTVVQPLGALTLVLALSASAGLARRRIGRDEWFGLALTMAGLAVLLSLTIGGSSRRGLSPDEVLGVSVVTMVAVAALVLGATRARGMVPRSLMHAAAAGIAFGTASALAQTVTVRMSRSGWDEVITPAAAVMVGLAFCGLLLAQAAYRAGVGAPLATLTIVNPIVAAAIGIGLLGERFDAGTGGAVLALLTGAVAAGGIVLLARGRRAGTMASADDVPPAAAVPSGAVP